MEVLVTTNFNNSQWLPLINDFKNTKQINKIFKRIYLRTIFTDSSKTLKTTALISNKAYYKNRNKVSS